MELQALGSLRNAAMHLQALAQEIRSLKEDLASGTAVCGSRDIPERGHPEASREPEFRSLVERMPDLVVHYDRDLRRTYVNPAFAAFAEGGAASLIGKKPSERSSWQYAATFEQKLAQVFATGMGLEFEVPGWRDLSDNQCSYLVRLVPEFDADGAVETVMSVGRDIRELTASRQKIQWLAFHDPVTALPNRALFKERLEQTIAAGGNARRGLIGVMMVDLDRLKSVNDTMGHAIGDELLRQAAERLQDCVRSRDTVARIGGDEFAVLLPAVHDKGALEDIARAMVARLDEGFSLQGREVFISCSIGIALYPTDSAKAEDLVQYADLAMYRVKRSGRRNFCFYSKELTVHASMHLQLDSELRRAIERGELALHYQPKVTGNGEVIGSEALLRWKRTGGGFVSPQHFIPIAEESGLIVDLGKWVLHEACRAAAEWNAPGVVLHKVAVNLSARQFRFFDLVAMVEEILRETGCRPEWLELELTESLFLEEDDNVLDALSSLKSMGLSIAIDDFGTGYSALSYLTRFPIDTLKIDQSFIHKVITDKRHAELVKAILSIARCLGLEVVAEGVETPEQEAFLRANGCTTAQGFLYSRPLPKPEMTALLKQLRQNAA
ncbi:EAL domain-containing protein [Paraburkholderia sp. MPAMCS5]|uniref:putative bifunctional diguanylate cyclase/phosphodiesterase n=1 Tax=Paraburkholderia sp. MPAMCS5 TaxID=3112563 RepID=UPI002E17A505|nr:EAL domain-containing protein [Paraburkholderia sp. MPAMCS5]